jgi:hypothetical protein
LQDPEDTRVADIYAKFAASDNLTMADSANMRVSMSYRPGVDYYETFAHRQNYLDPTHSRHHGAQRQVIKSSLLFVLGSCRVSNRVSLTVYRNHLNRLWASDFPSFALAARISLLPLIAESTF